SDQHVFHGRRAVVLGGEDLRVVRVERELPAVALLLTQPIEALDRRSAVRAADPVTGGAPAELRGLRSLLQRFARTQQCLDVDAVVDFQGRDVHLRLLLERCCDGRGRRPGNVKAARRALNPAWELPWNFSRPAWKRGQAD